MIAPNGIKAATKITRAHANISRAAERNASSRRTAANQFAVAVSDGLRKTPAATPIVVAMARSSEVGMPSCPANEDTAPNRREFERTLVQGGKKRDARAGWAQQFLKCPARRHEGTKVN